MKHVWIVALIVCGVLSSLVFGATLHLKDGTKLEGEIKKVGGSYSIKLKDGSLKLIPGSDVASVDDGSEGGAPSGATGSTSGLFNAAKNAAERVESPILAVAIWQKYLDDYPGGPNLAEAKAELKRWKDMADNGAEKIKGKWVTGDELKQLHEKVDKLIIESLQLMVNNQTLKSIEKLQEVIRIYPNCYEAHFELGYYYLLKGGNDQVDKAIASLETASKLRPNAPEALTNLAIAYNFRRNYEKAVTSAYKAAQIEDSKPIVQNLVNAISFAPPGMRQNNPKVRPIMDETTVLMARHGISGPSSQWAYVRPRPQVARGRPGRGGDDDERGPRGADGGVVGSGTGFFLTADGYIMTNRHVAAAGEQLLVRLSDGTQKVAQKVLVDDQQDIAILKIKSDKPTPFIRLASYDSPPIGTDVTVMGFPLGAMLGSHVKITRGVVTSFETDKDECDVIVDAQVNPGNSGGPMIDKYGNLLALVAMKTYADEAVSSYGLGISTGRLRKFMDRQKTKLGALKLELPEESKTVLNTEEIAGKYTSATVMIMIVSGELPEGLK